MSEIWLCPNKPCGHGTLQGHHDFGRALRQPVAMAKLAKGTSCAGEVLNSLYLLVIEHGNLKSQLFMGKHMKINQN